MKNAAKKAVWACIDLASALARSSPFLKRIIKKTLFKAPNQPRPVFAGIVEKIRRRHEAARQGPQARPAAPALPGLSAAAVLRPRLCVVAMARNESLRVHDAMGHFCALFDRVLLVDHLSSDNTAGMAAAYNGQDNTEVIILRGLDSGYYQSEYMSACANALLAEGAMDWIFFLDFDEFLPFTRKSDLHQALARFAAEPVLHMPWHNLALKKLSPPTLQGAACVIGPDASIYRKIALNARAVGSNARVTIEQGNHAAILSESSQPISGPPAFGLFHVPILDVAALRSKLKQGVAAYGNSRGKPQIMGYHWRELDASIDGFCQDQKLLTEISLNYSQPLRDTLKNAARGIFTENTREICLRFAQCARPSPLSGNVDSPWQGEFNLENIDAVLAGIFGTVSRQGEGPNKTASLGRLLPAPVYAALPSLERPAPEAGEMLKRALAAASMAAEDEKRAFRHAPFLRAIIEMFQPSRYVELGADAASFLAGARLVSGYGGEAVAVGDWPHNEPLWRDRLALREAFGQGTGLIRGCATAPGAFAPGSIDMLFMKWPLDYGGLKQAWTVWKPLLTPKGGILLVANAFDYASGHGAWQFFAEIRGEGQASFLFSHGGGLGSIAFGDSPAQILKLLSENAQLAELLFAGLAAAPNGQ